LIGGKKEKKELLTHPLLFSLYVPDLLERQMVRPVEDGLEDVYRGRMMLFPRRIHVREQLNKIATIGG
jgi:hypothetical protein